MGDRRRDAVGQQMPEDDPEDRWPQQFGRVHVGLVRLTWSAITSSVASAASRFASAPTHCPPLCKHLVESVVAILSEVQGTGAARRIRRRQKRVQNEVDRLAVGAAVPDGMVAGRRFVLNTEKGAAAGWAITPIPAQLCATA